MGSLSLCDSNSRTLQYAERLTLKAKGSPLVREMLSHYSFDPAQSMPTYLTLLIGRLLTVGILVTAYSRLLLAGRPFILRVLTSGVLTSGGKQTGHWRKQASETRDFCGLFRF